jgi:hypothetical protein
VRIQFNGDTTAGNYTSTQYIAGVGASASANTLASSSAGMVMAALPGTQFSANALGNSRIHIPLYNGTTFQKMVNAVAAEYGATSGPTQVDYVFTGVWNSTAAITSILLTCGGTAFVNGTTATLYGIG